MVNLRVLQQQVTERDQRIKQLQKHFKQMQEYCRQLEDKIEADNRNNQNFVFAVVYKHGPLLKFELEDFYALMQGKQISGGMGVSEDGMFTVNISLTDGETNEKDEQTN